MAQMNNKLKLFLNCNPDIKALELPELKQLRLTILSSFYKSGRNLRMELIYTKDGWIPTWRLAKDCMDSIIYEDYVDVTFAIEVLEGTILKRVEKINDKTETKLFMVTRSGLVEILYDYERGVYVLNTGVRIPDDRKKSFLKK